MTWLQALFTQDDDTSDEEEADTDEPDVIGADELQGGNVSEISSSKQRWVIVATKCCTHFACCGSFAPAMLKAQSNSPLTDFSSI